MTQTQPTTNILQTADLSKGHRALTKAAGNSLLPSFLSLWPWWLVPAFASLILVLAFLDPFIGDWDALDYTTLSVRGYPSSMALGRSLFIFGNHALYELARLLTNVPAEKAYLIFKYAVVAQAPVAVIGCWILAREVTNKVWSATLAALFVAFSPVFVLYGGQVMTDVPSVLLLVVALTIHLIGVKRRRMWLTILGAAVLGLGVNLRETVGFYAPWLLIAPLSFGWKLRGRELFYIVLACVVFLLCAVGWFGYWFITDLQYRSLWLGWRESMRQEAARHPVLLRNLWPFLAYLFVSAPFAFLAFPFAAVKEWSEQRLSPLLLLGAMGLFADALLLLNYSTAVNWRYFLTGLPGLAPLSANYLITTLTVRFKSTRLAFASCVVGVLVFAVVFGICIRPISREFIERRAMSREYRQQLAKLPGNAVIIAGSQTIAVLYWKAIGAGDWETIGTGGGWPGNRLVPQIDTYMAQGRRVFLDADPRWWLPCGWQRDEIFAISQLEEQFHFRRVTDTVYELLPASQSGAYDSPNLKRLLPENRPKDARKCPPGGA